MSFPTGKFNADQGIFLSTVSAHTGIDPTVVLAWMGQEGAFSGKESGKFNYLNIMGPNGPVSYPNSGAAATATINLLHQSNMGMIVHTAQTKPTPAEEINAIASSPWDTGHYGGKGGPTLVATYESYFGKGSSTHPYHSPSTSSTLIQSAGGTQGGDSTDTILPVTGPPIGFANPFASIGDFFRWLGGNWDRVLFVTGGMILIILAIVIFMKQQQRNMFTFSRGDE